MQPSQSREGTHIHNLKGRMSAELETFSGTITLADPTSLPEGGSPRNQNMDFNVGSAFTRGGLESEYSYAGNFFGPNPATRAVNTTITGDAWSNLASALTLGGYADCALIAGVQSVSMTAGGLYVFAGISPPSVVFSGPGPGGAAGFALMAPNGLGQFYVAGVRMLYTGSYTGPVTVSFVGGRGSGAAGTANLQSIPTDALDLTQFGFSIPPTVSPQGILATVYAYATGGPAILYAQMLKAGVPYGFPVTVGTLSSTPQQFSVGGINGLFNEAWVYSDFNITSF